jgi:hypothetical protein
MDTASDGMFSKVMTPYSLLWITDISLVITKGMVNLCSDYVYCRKGALLTIVSERVDSGMNLAE